MISIKISTPLGCWGVECACHRHDTYLHERLKLSHCRGLREVIPIPCRVCTRSTIPAMIGWCVGQILYQHLQGGQTTRRVLPEVVYEVELRCPPKCHRRQMVTSIPKHARRNLLVEREWRWLDRGRAFVHDRFTRHGQLRRDILVVV